MDTIYLNLLLIPVNSFFVAITPGTFGKLLNAVVVALNVAIVASRLS